MASELVDQEARRLAGLPTSDMRRQFGDRVARAFQSGGADHAEQLDFNAQVATRLRELKTAPFYRGDPRDGCFW